MTIHENLVEGKLVVQCFDIKIFLQEQQRVDNLETISISSTLASWSFETRELFLKGQSYYYNR